MKTQTFELTLKLNVTRKVRPGDVEGSRGAPPTSVLQGVLSALLLLRYPDPSHVLLAAILVLQLDSAVVSLRSPSS